MGEPIDQLGNPHSASISFIREYATAIVTRYRNSPAIWAWEFGNEYNLQCDLPNHDSHRPAVQPSLGTPTTRTERDELEFGQLKVALQAFTDTVRKLDLTRVILTGNAAPRASAWHNVTENSRSPDSRAQFGEILLRDNPDPIDLITIHVYQEPTRSDPGDAKSLDDSTPERDGAQQLLARVLGFFAWLRLLWVDGGFSGEGFAKSVETIRPKLKVEVVKRSDTAKGLEVLPRRWIVERTFGWLMRSRRLARDYETTPESAEAWILIAMIRLQLRRLA